MTDQTMELLIDLHRKNKRQGPGSDSDTLKALSFIQIEKGKNYKIADIGCGSGSQTISIAKAINGEIIAVDLFSEFLNTLEQNAKAEGLGSKITTLKASMEELPFKNEEFDIIWSEGAIYNMGFENGIKNWEKFLKKGGYMALSEITWLTYERPSEIEKHWNNEYPEISTASHKIKLLEENGFSFVGYFYLPQSSWIDSYYEPIENSFNSFLKKHNNSEIAKNIVEGEKKEIYLYKKYKDYIGYGFYIVKKI
jgi:ubiquinone/menaquinone biosynthesis C-methylase UbiE